MRGRLFVATKLNSVITLHYGLYFHSNFTDDDIYLKTDSEIKKNMYLTLNVTLFWKSYLNLVSFTKIRIV